MSTSTAVFQLHQREAFERNVARSLAAGAGAGALAFVAQRIGLNVPIMYLALVGSALSCVRGDRMDRILLAALSVVLPAVPWVLGLSSGWTVALAASAVGALMVKARVCEKGDEGSVASDRPGFLNYVLGAFGCAGLSVAGFEVAKVLTANLAALDTPKLLLSLSFGVVVALFAAIGSLAAHLALKPDPVEARCEELIPQLSGEFRQLATRALELYRQCGQSLASLPREGARDEMARTLSRLTKDAVELAGEWSGVEAQVEETAQKDLAEQVAELTRSAAAAKDAVARKQLELAAASLREEMGQLGELRLRRERILAKLKAQVALLDRAKVALIGLRSGHAQVRAAELSALARKFAALSNVQSDEAKLADAVATSAELAQHEAELAAAVKVAEAIAHSAPAEEEERPAIERKKVQA